jgi:MFS family permease
MMRPVRSTPQYIAAGGGLLVSLDSLVNVAFPVIGAYFHLAPEELGWVIVCYVMMYALTSFVGGAVGDHVGHGRVFIIGVAGSVFAYAAAAAAPAFAWLLVARAIQGIAGGLVYGTAPGLVTLATPGQARGRALGFLNAGIGLGFAVGPLAAGVLLIALGWRAVFYVRAPLAAVLLLWALVALPPGHGRLGARRLRLGDIARRQVVYAAVLAFLANAGIFAIWFLAPFYLVDRRGLDAVTAGLLFTLAPLGTTLAAPVAGRLVDAGSARLPVIGGLLVEAAGLAVLSRASAETSKLTLALVLGAAGAGLGLFQVPNMAIMMAAFPGRQQGAAGGLAFLARTLGVVAGVLLLAQVFAARRAVAGFDAAFAEAHVVAAGVVAGGAALAAVTRRRPGRSA